MQDQKTLIDSRIFPQVGVPIGSRSRTCMMISQSETWSREHVVRIVGSPRDESDGVVGRHFSSANLRCVWRRLLRASRSQRRILGIMLVDLDDVGTLQLWPGGPRALRSRTESWRVLLTVLWMLDSREHNEFEMLCSKETFRNGLPLQQSHWKG